MRTLSRTKGRILNAFTIEKLDSGPPVGRWRQSHTRKNRRQHLFRRILVGISKDDTQWQSLNQAIFFARKEGAILHGLHVAPTSDQVDTPETVAIITEFQRRCEQAGIAGDMAIEVGTAARKICKRAQWSDMRKNSITNR